MTVNAITPDHAQAQAAYSQPADKPDTSATKPPQDTTNNAEQPQNAPPPQTTQVYFFEANLGNHVNILV